MSIDDDRADYHAAVRATILWAAITSSAAIAIALPVILVGLLILSQGLTMPVSRAELTGGLLITALAGLLLFGILRCVVLSTAEVKGSPGYPARHWWFVRRALRSVWGIDLFFFVAGAGLTAFAVLGPGRLAVDASIFAAIADSLFLYSSTVSVFGVNDVLRHASVVPYFPQQIGEIETYARGYSLARHVAQLDAIAEALDLAPLSSFGWNDDMEGEPLVWHEALAGLATVAPLLAHLEADPLPWTDQAETVDDLQRLAHALARAHAQGISFSLLLLHSSATNAQEWEIRKGTCF